MKSRTVVPTTTRLSRSPNAMAQFAVTLSIRSVFAFLMTVTARGDTVTTATGANTTLQTAQAFGSPDLAINRLAPNYSLATAQAISPKFYAEDAVGSLTAASPQEFFSLPAFSGQEIVLQAGSAQPVSLPTQVLLYNPNGDLVAVSGGNGPNGTSLLTFPVPSGEAGKWTAEVMSQITTSYQYDLRIESPIMYKTDVLGALDSPAHTGFYAISTNAGDQLNLSVNTPLGSANELLLYNPNGDLVAVADGNGTAGGSVIDFGIPSGEAGNYYAEVAGSPFAPDPNTDLFHYDLTIQGATGTGPVDPLAPNPPAAVPEPASCALIGGPLVGFALFGYLRRRQTRCL